MEYVLNVALLNADILLRLAMAFALGGVIGLEREIHGRPAGLRTHMLVCVGAAIIMIAAQLQQDLYRSHPGDIRIVIDPGRIVAGIMTGIGFLGAGAILRMGDLVRGLTTAACIWFVAALGIVIGEGMYGLAVVSTFSVVIALILFQHIEYPLKSLVYDSLVVAGPIAKIDPIETRCVRELHTRNIRIQDKSYTLSKTEGWFEITFHLRMRGREQKSAIVRTLTAIPDVMRVTWE